MQPSSIDLGWFPQDNPGPLQPLFDFIKEERANVRHAEAGVAMVGDDLSAEFYVVPVAGSPLAQSLADPQQAEVAAEYAGYLPDNLAYCGASGPMLKGAPGSARTLLKIG